MDAVGIQFPAGKSLGDPHNLKMRFDSAFSKLAMDGNYEFSLIHAPLINQQPGRAARSC